MGDQLEKTGEAQRGHDLVTGPVPIIVSDDERHDLFARKQDDE